MNSVQVLWRDVFQPQQLAKHTQGFLLTLFWRFSCWSWLLGDEKELEVPQPRVLFIAVTVLLCKLGVEVGLVYQPLLVSPSYQPLHVSLVYQPLLVSLVYQPLHVSLVYQPLHIGLPLSALPYLLPQFLVLILQDENFPFSNLLCNDAVMV